MGPASPYVTGTISYDSKILQKRIPNVSEINYFGLGGMLMFDKAMGGTVKSTYASVNLSYTVKIAEDYNENVHKLSAGFGAIYGRRYTDFSELDFQEQFVGHGFNTSLPTGETALSNMKAYLSSSLGLVYNFKNEKRNLDIGLAGFHLNKPKQTFLEDKNQYLAIRTVAHANFEAVISSRLILNTNAIYQKQSSASYFSVGGALGYALPEEESTIINAGLWYWSRNAIIPYLGFAYKDLQVGISSDITISKLAQADNGPNTFEISLIVRGSKKPTGIIPCFWK